MNLQRLSIRQTYATIEIETRQAKQQMESPPGDLQIESAPAEMEISKTHGGLKIDNSKAWLALGNGNHLEWYRMVTDQMEGQFLVNLSNIVEEGNRLAKFKVPGNTIADMMVNRTQEKTIIRYVGEASADNVKLEFSPDQLNVDWSTHEPNIEYTPNKPYISVEPGAVDVYLKNKNSIQMWVSNYDIYA
ncbi:DUF6470 family protein [Paenibacillus rhizolycopersici]|uniref:DUF6470 family protein n=1 Tax=Paenibacillus rhizolycopersici TaxID=2780073 RepID=UPI003D29A67C